MGEFKGLGNLEGESKCSFDCLQAVPRRRRQRVAFDQLENKKRVS